MAKRRSMNRRWSRRSVNNSAFLNDDTNILEGEDDYWRYLNQTNSRPPSGVNITAATAVLDPNSSLLDSNASATQWEYLEKSNDNTPQRFLKNSSKPSSTRDSNIGNSPENASHSDSEASTKVRKKRPLLGPPRKAKPKNVFSMNSSESTVEVNVHSPPQNSEIPQNNPEKSRSQVSAFQTSPQDSMTSLESEKVEKRRPRFKRQTLKQRNPSLPVSDTSIIPPSQEPRGTIIRPRRTFLSRSSGKIKPKPVPKTQKDFQENSTSDADTTDQMSQPRRIFRRLRKLKSSDNPFVGILDDSKEQSQIVEASPLESRENQSKTISTSPEDQSKVQPELDNPQDPGGEDELSDFSISEELKVSTSNAISDKSERSRSLRQGNEKKTFDDYPKFKDSELNIREEDIRINILDDDQNDSESTKDEGGSEAENTRDSLQKRDSIEDQRLNDSKKFREFRVSHVESNKSLTHPEIPRELCDPEQERSLTMDTGRLTRSLRAQSSRSGLAGSPIISGSMSQHERTLNSTRAGEKRKSLRKNLSFTRTPHRDGQVNRSYEVRSTVEAPDHQEVNSKAGNDNSRSSRDVSSDPHEREIANEPQNQINRSRSHSESHPTEHSEHQKINSDTELDVETISENEPIGTLSHLDLRGSLSQSLTTSQNLSSNETAGKHDIQRRPGPRSFKEAQRSVLSHSRFSNASKASPEAPESTQKPETMPNKAASLSEKSSRKGPIMRADNTLYDLPPPERTPSVSISESDHEAVLSPPAPRTPTKPKSGINATPEATRSRYKRRKVESEDEEHQSLTKKPSSTPSELSAPVRPPISPKIIVVHPQNEDNILPIDIQLESTSSGVLKERGISADDPPVERGKNFRQLKINDLLRPSQREIPKKWPSSTTPFDPEEFKKKLKESKQILEKIRAREAEVDRNRGKNKKEQVKKVMKGFPQLKKPKKVEKIVNRAYIVNGRVYHRPKLPRPRHWATNKLYKFLWRKMEPKFGDQCRIKSEKFVVELNEVMTIIMRRKKYDNYKGELNELLRKMAELGIIETRRDFHGFCFDFLPFEFRIKVVPMLQAGNVHNIPFEPDKLLEPILG